MNHKKIQALAEELVKDLKTPEDLSAQLTKITYPLVNRHMMGIEVHVREPFGRAEVFRGVPSTECFPLGSERLAIGTDMHDAFLDLVVFKDR
jgi:hypothetical protein